MDGILPVEYGAGYRPPTPGLGRPRRRRRRLRVRRVVDNEGPAFYDLFSREGDHLGSVRLGFDAGQYATLWVRHGSIYTWVEDELDVPYVVRAPIPELR